MAEIPGGLIVEMFPDGRVRLVFLADIGGGNESPITAKDLDEAEALFMTCGISAELAAALRNEVQRNKVASLNISIDENTAQRFRYTIPSR
jgi:hypothetical protein